MSRRLAALVPALVAASLLAGCAAAPAAPAPTPTSVDLSTFDPETDGNGLTLLSAAAARDVVLHAIGDAAGGTATVRFEDASGRTIDARITGSTRRYDADLAVDGETTRIAVDGADARVLSAGSGTWVCAAANDPLVTRWAPLTGAHALVEALTQDASGLGAPQDGVVDLLLGSDSTQGALTVATTGAPLPVRLVRADAAGRVEATFADWDEPAPAEALPDC